MHITTLILERINMNPDPLFNSPDFSGSTLLDLSDLLSVIAHLQSNFPDFSLTLALVVRLLRSGKFYQSSSQQAPKNSTCSLALLSSWFLPVPSSLRSKTAQLLNCPADPDHNSPSCKKKPSTPPH
jgi:hypothetical protein